MKDLFLDEAKMSENLNPNEYDVVIIGAGIVGAMIARELSRYEGRIAVLEKEPCPGWGASKGSLAMVHAPDFCPPGTLKGKFCLNAPERFRRLSEELEVAYREVDELWLALESSQISAIEDAKKRGESHGGTGFEIIGGDRVRELEPHVNPEVVAALYIRGLGVVHPPEWAFALVENAVQNGVQCHLKTEVLDIERTQGENYVLRTSRGSFQSRWIINAAGLFADEIAAMAGDTGIRLTLTKGTMAIFDKSVSHLVRHMVYGTFSKGHSQAITPTVHGNLLLGLGHFTTPNHKGDFKIEASGLQDVIRMGKELIPCLSEKDIISTFTGIRSDNNQAANGDFFIAPSYHSPGVIHAIIGQPGLTAAPAVAEHVIGLLAKEGFPLVKKGNLNGQRRSWPVFSEGSMAEKDLLTRSNPAYGRLVCRCEKVTEGEILEAIRRGADTLDGIKHLTRAGMGSCQGGFCGTTLLHLLSGQLGTTPQKVTKKGRGSHSLSDFSGTKSGS
jgi:glycerol-3-phosphate dehydrogenase